MTTKSELIDHLRRARDEGNKPKAPNADLWGADLRGADLRGADLRGADLRGADLREADLREADLRGAYLREADLRGADLREADLRGAYLRDADLWGADLREADLREADLRGADLRDADLREADLREADLRGARWDGLCIDGLPSGRFLLIPTAQGWIVNQGFYRATFSEFVEMTASDDWPESRGEEILRRRPLQQAAIALSEAHIKDHEESGTITRLGEKWGEKGEAHDDHRV